MTTSECIKCGFASSISSEFCEKCGIELTPAVAADRAVRYVEAGAEGDRTVVQPTIPPFDSVSAAVSPTIGLFVRNFVLISKIVLVVFAPYEILRATSFTATSLTFQSYLWTVVLGLFCRALVAPALIYALVNVIDAGRAPTLSESYRWSLTRIGPLIACAIAAWLARTVGFLLLVIPGIIVSLAFIVVYPIATLDGGRPVDVLKRSYELTLGYKWRILGASLVISLLSSIVGIPMTFAGALANASGVLWPVAAAAALAADVIGESGTVLSLVIYLGLLNKRAVLTEDLPNPEAR